MPDRTTECMPVVCPYEHDRSELRAAVREMNDAVVVLRLLTEEWRAADAPQRLTRLESVQADQTRRLEWHERAGIGVLVGVATLVGWFGDVKGWW